MKLRMELVSKIISPLRFTSDDAHIHSLMDQEALNSNPTSELRRKGPRLSWLG